MAWEPDRRSSFFSEPVTFITNIYNILLKMNPKIHISGKIGFKYIEFVENAHSEESAIYFKENKFGEDVPIKKKNNCDKYVYFLVV